MRKVRGACAARTNPGRSRAEGAHSWSCQPIRQQPQHLGSFPQAHLLQYTDAPTRRGGCRGVLGNAPRGRLPGQPSVVSKEARLSAGAPTQEHLSPASGRPHGPSQPAGCEPGVQGHPAWATRPPIRAANPPVQPSHPLLLGYPPEGVNGALVQGRVAAGAHADTHVLGLRGQPRGRSGQGGVRAVGQHSTTQRSRAQPDRAGCRGWQPASKHWRA